MQQQIMSDQLSCPAHDSVVAIFRTAFPARAASLEFRAQGRICSLKGEGMSIQVRSTYPGQTFQPSKNTVSFNLLDIAESVASWWAFIIVAAKYLPSSSGAQINHQCSSPISTSSTSTPSTNHRPSPFTSGPSRISLPLIIRLRIFPVSLSNVQSSSP